MEERGSRQGGGLGSRLRLPSRGAWLRSSDFIARLTAELRDDIPLHACVAAYVGVVFVFAQLLGRSEKFEPLLYAQNWLAALPVIFLPSFLCAVAVAGIVDCPAAPLTGLARVLRRTVSPRLVAGLALFTSVTVFYGSFTSAKNLLPDVARFGWDVYFADLGERMHGGVPPWQILQPILSPYTRIIDYFYSSFWLAAMLGMVFCMAASSVRRRRFFIAFFLCWIVLGNVLAGIFFSAGPIFYDRVVGDPSRYHALLSFVAGYHDPPLSVNVYQSYLWAIYRQGETELGSGISAFPSMHVSMATMVAIWLFHSHRLMLVPALFFLLLTLLGSVHLGWHYAVDGYAAILLTLLIWWAVDRIASRGERRAAVPLITGEMVAAAGRG